MRERLKRAVLKTAIPERVSGVQIPLPPPDILAGFLRLARRGGLAQDFGARLRRRQAPQLENRYTRKVIEDSNPSPSANS